MKKKQYLYIVSILIAFIIISILLNIIVFVSIIDISSNQRGNQNQDIIDAVDIYRNCKTDDLKTVAICLHEGVSQIYKYNITNIDKKLSFTQLVKEGGVCSHYSEIYASSARNLGFNGTIANIPMGDAEYWHAFAIISDNSGYCVMEQRNTPSCYFVNMSSQT